MVRREPFVAAALVPLLHEHVDRVHVVSRLVVLGAGFDEGVGGLGA